MVTALPPEAAGARNNSELKAMLAAVRKKFNVAFETVSLGTTSFEILQITNMEQVLERMAENALQISLPFWAKLWPSSLMTAQIVLSLPPGEGKRALEIGAGTGLCGLCAAENRYRTIISDAEPEAVTFIQANILKNNLQNSATACPMDYTDDAEQKPVDLIIGTEILYRTKTHGPLLDFLARNLRPGGSILLGAEMQRSAESFFLQADKVFSVQRTCAPYKDQETGEKRTCCVYRLAFREDAR